MFVQLHMLQSMPPGNLNRDETGQPKKCIFGGITRGRISSQCLKRNIRLSTQFKEAFGDALADRTTYLPRMVTDELKKNRDKLGVPEDEQSDLMLALASKFKKEKRRSESDGEEQQDEGKADGDGSASADDGTGQTGQLVFFPPPFALQIAKLVAALRRQSRRAYDGFIGRKIKPKLTENEEKEIQGFMENVAVASKSLTVDIGLFGRMTTSDLVVNVEAACQVAHAISTHETVIESDWFTAMDDRKASYAKSQTEKAGAAFMGTGETETFYNAAVYYKYLNLDIQSLRDAKHLPSLSAKDAARVAGVLVSAAALANPTGKQNSFASHSIPELILVELSSTKRPISYANAFLQPVEGPDFLANSAEALKAYVEAVAPAFAPVDAQRVLLAVGHAKVSLEGAHRVGTLDELVKSVVTAAVPKKEQATA